MTKILGILGSPRKNGNTEIILKEILNSAKEVDAQVEMVRLAELDFKGCKACGGCDKTGTCTVKDDMQKLYPKLIENNRFVVASPIFFKNISWLTKSMIDRAQCMWVAKYKLKRVPWVVPPERIGAFVSTCGTNRRDMFEPAIATMKSFFAVLDIKYDFELLFEGIDEKGEVNDHPELLLKARMLGKNLAE